jgi:hypothetical protein
MNDFLTDLVLRYNIDPNTWGVVGLITVFVVVWFSLHMVVKHKR